MIRYAAIAAGIVLMPTLWVLVKSGLDVDDRYLPSIHAVAKAVVDIEPSVAVHALYSFSRLITGAAAGIAFGVALGLVMHASRLGGSILIPSVQSMRAIPPLAMVPFFLLWFGFSEIGKFLLIVVGIGFNVAIASLQIAETVEERYRVFFRSIDRAPSAFPISFALPRVLEELLPTARFSVATAAGLVVVAELLGSQIGLGYLMQTARSTFATHTIFLAAILFGLIATAADILVRMTWTAMVFWKDASRD